MRTRKAHVAYSVEYDDSYLVRMLVTNPKKEGSKAHKRFALYRDGMTVREGVDAGVTGEDLSHDIGRGHIAVQPANLAAQLVESAQS
jgi:hypothetical protein